LIVGCVAGAMVVFGVAVLLFVVLPLRFLMIAILLLSASAFADRGCWFLLSSASFSGKNNTYPL
jgi:hypothetical protein